MGSLKLHGGHRERPKGLQLDRGRWGRSSSAGVGVVGFVGVDHDPRDDVRFVVLEHVVLHRVQPFLVHALRVGPEQLLPEEATGQKEISEEIWPRAEASDIVINFYWLWPERLGYSEMVVVLRVPGQGYFQLQYSSKHNKL